MKNKYWFRKRKGLFTKDLGWGWAPISWEGWIVTFLFIIIVWQIFTWANLIIAIIMLAFIADYKSEEKVIFK